MPAAGTKQLSLFACMLTASARHLLAPPPAQVIKPPRLQNRQRLKLFKAVTSTFPHRTFASVTSSITPGQDVTLSAVAVAASPVTCVDMSQTCPDGDAHVVDLQQDGPVPDNVCNNIDTLCILPVSSSDLVVVTSSHAGGLWVRGSHTMHCNETYPDAVSGCITSSPRESCAGVTIDNVGPFPTSLEIVNPSKISTGKEG